MSRRRSGGLSFYEKKKTITHNQIYQFISWFVLTLGAVLLAWVVVYGWGIKSVVIGDSMSPGLVNGQEILIDRIRYNVLEPKRGDIIVFKPNGNENVHTYVKRVVGVPGDSVQIMNGMLFLNGTAVPDLFSDSIADPGMIAEELTLGTDEYFVMGDNCNSSEDSRTANIGNVRKESIIGRAWFHMAGGNQGLGVIK
ncbi:MAG: signal peptidase I [Lachnospiraceae bacterium]|nr:signal peptidase I [Lachnospiraceae bacterium]